MRALLFYEVDSAGNPDSTAVVRSLFDSLMATILVTTSVTLAINWFKPPVNQDNSEVFIQSFEIDQYLRKGASDTREWFYLGHTARYIRSQILPFVNQDSLAKNENKVIKVIILNPYDEELCEFYATYRNHSRSISVTNEKWSKEKVRDDLIATVLCMIELQQANSMLQVDAGFQNSVSLFRADISSSMTLITQEDNQEPAIRYSSDSHFYRNYRRELDLAWRQSIQLKISEVKTPLNLNDSGVMRICLEEVGFDTKFCDDETLVRAGIQAQIKKSPYVTK